MTNEDLCALALSAIDDADARVVLIDAMQEAEPYFDERMRIHLGHAVYHGWDEPGIRAIAAVLLFGEWPTSWPLAERCRRLHVNPWRVQQDDLLRAFETALRCPEGWLQRITLMADDGIYNDDLNIRVERWPAGQSSMRVTTDRSISRHEIALSRDFIGLIVHEAQRIDRAFQDHADKVTR